MNSNPLKEGELRISAGNSKVSRALILNICSSTDCPFRDTQACIVCRMKSAKLPVGCYGLEGEQRFHTVLAFHREQAAYWDSHTAEQIADSLARLADRHARRGKAFTMLRASEVGDMRTAADARKLGYIGNRMIGHGIKNLWTYTVNRSAAAELKSICPSFTVHGSGWAGPNGATAVLLGEDTPAPSGWVVCPGQCGPCLACAGQGNIVFRGHGSHKNVGRVISAEEGADIFQKYYGHLL